MTQSLPVFYGSYRSDRVEIRLACYLVGAREIRLDFSRSRSIVMRVPWLA